MLDTLQVSLAGWRVRDRNKLRLQPAPIDLESGERVGEVALWRSEGDGLVEGAKAYYNDDELNLSIQSLNRRPFCFVKVSVPKVLRGSNYHGVSVDETRRALELVGERLHSIGVESNLDEAQLTRVDLFKNVVTENSFGSYRPLFSLLSGRRMQSRDFGETFLWMNSARELTCYDKIQELTLQKKSTEGLPSNVVRFESRLKQHRVIEKVGLSTVGDLVRDYGRLPKIYNEAWESGLFSFDVPDIERLSENRLLNELMMYRRVAGRFWLQRYLEDVGTVSLLERVGGPEVLRRVVASMYGDREVARVQTWRLLKRVESARRRRLPTIELYDRRTLGDYYTELKTKLLAA